MSKNAKYDVVIVGGGLAGLSLSCLLGRHGIKLACIDLADPKIKPKDLRTTVISLRIASDFGACRDLEKFERHISPSKIFKFWMAIPQSC